MPILNTEQTIDDTNWHHLSITVNKVLNKLIVYLDNTNVKEVDLSTLDTINDNSNVTISFEHNGEIQSIELAKLDNQWQLSQSSGTHSLEIDQFTVTNTALSQRQIEDDLATFPVVELTPSATSITQDSPFNGSVIENSIVKTEDKMKFNSATNSSVVVTSDKFTNYKLNQFTVSSWINPETQNVDMGVMSALLTNQHMMQFSINSDNKIVFQATLSSVQETSTNVQNNIITLSGKVADDSVNVSTLTYFTEQTSETIRADLLNNLNDNYVITSTPLNKTFSHDLTHVLYNGSVYESSTFPEFHAYTISHLSTNVQSPIKVVDEIKHTVVSVQETGYAFAKGIPTVDDNGLSLSYSLSTIIIAPKYYIGVFGTEFANGSTDAELLNILTANTFSNATLIVNTSTEANTLISSSHVFANGITSINADEVVSSSNGYIIKLFVTDDTSTTILHSDYVEFVAIVLSSTDWHSTHVAPNLTHIEILQYNSETNNNFSESITTTDTSDTREVFDYHPSSFGTRQAGMTLPYPSDINDVSTIKQIFTHYEGQIFFVTSTKIYDIGEAIAHGTNQTNASSMPREIPEWTTVFNGLPSGTTIVNSYVNYWHPHQSKIYLTLSDGSVYYVISSGYGDFTNVNQSYTITLLNGTNQINNQSRLDQLGISREDITQFINVGNGLSIVGYYMSHTLRTNDTINPDRVFTWNDAKSHILQEIKFNGTWSSLNLPNGDEGGTITDGDNDSFLRYYSVVSSFLYGLGGGWGGIGAPAYVIFQHKVTKAYKILKISNTASFDTTSLLITANLVDSGNPPFETWMNSKRATN